MKFISPVLGYSLKLLSLPVQIYAERMQSPYSTKENIRILKNISYGKHRQQKMDVFSVESKHLLPVLVFVHGGAWICGDKSLYTSNCNAYAEAGYIVFNINYRLAPGFNYQDQLQDIAGALLWIQNNAHTYNGDASELFIAGDSTGANLVLNYANALEQSYLRDGFKLPEMIKAEYIRGLILIYGTFDLESDLFKKIPIFHYFYEMLFGANQLEQNLHLGSPARHLHRFLPPVFIAAGEVDPLFDQSHLLSDQLKKIKSYHQTLFLKRKQHADARHFFFQFQKRECAKQLLKESFKFMSQQTQGMGHNVIRFMPFLRLGS